MVRACLQLSILIDLCFKGGGGGGGGGGRGEGGPGSENLKT